MLQDRFRGCLIGGGVGDALGYPVEFMRLSAIKSTYGTDGVQDLILERESGKAQISDDTQMTLFTASGLLWAAHRIRMRKAVTSYQMEFTRLTCGGSTRRMGLKEMPKY